MYKLIAIDIDGTLLNSYGEITNKNREAIKYAMDKLSNKVDELKLRIPKNENRLNEVFKKDNDRSLELFDQLFNGSNL